MDKQIKFFIPNRETWRKGFFIPVRNRLNNMLERDFLPEDMKELYQEEWGEAILYDDEFIDWYSRIKKEAVLARERRVREQKLNSQ
ncbi:MAG: hypothetical protein MI922_22075 [Bacteroidales bacterium]|nr:hypothetical protein [Bacteroidales bacterium]